MKKYKAVLFDFDGTLIDTNDFIIGSWRAVSEEIFGEMKFDLDYLASFFGTPLEYAAEETRKDYGIEGYDYKDICRIYRDYQKNNQDKFGKPFDGIPELLFALKEKGIKLGVVTSRLRKTTIDALERNGIASCFDAVIGEEDTDIHKPLPEPCLLCCERLGVDPADVLMVGDSRYDIECGKTRDAEAPLFPGHSLRKPRGSRGYPSPII